MIEIIMWVVPILLFILIAPFTPLLDLSISDRFYQLYQFHPPTWVEWIYTYGTWPGLIVGGASGLMLGLSLYYPHWFKWRRPAFYLLAVLVLFEGLIVHPILKEVTQRPRPKQIVQFGGEQLYKPFYIPHFHNNTPSKSFPCGHCGMGFYFFAVARLGWRRGSRPMMWSGIALAVLLGGALSFARMVQGGHFFSDVLGSFVVLWYGMLICDYWILRSQSVSSESGSNSSSL